MNFFEHQEKARKATAWLALVYALFVAAIVLCVHLVVSVAVFALAAETEEEAERLCATRNLWVMQLLRNQAGPFPSPEEAFAYPYTPEDRIMLRAISARGVTGTPDKVKAGLERMATDYEADEVTVLTITHDFAARVRSYELIAKSFGLGH